MTNDIFMQLSAAEPFFKRFRLLLRPVASTVKQRVTCQDVFPWAQNTAMAQPAFSALAVPSRHIQLLLGCFCSSFFGVVFFSGGFHAAQPMPSIAYVPFFWIFMAVVHMGCENELLGKSAGWLKVEGGL